MKTSLLSTVFATLSLPLLAQHYEVAHVADLTAEQKATARSITLTENPTEKGNSDWRQLRDLCCQLDTLDLSCTTIQSIPDGALMGHGSLRFIKYPTSLRHIGDLALAGCPKLEHPLPLIPYPTSVNTAPSAEDFKVTKADIKAQGQEGYILTIDAKGKQRIYANTSIGRFYAQQTLAQLGSDARNIVIKDKPMLAVRELMLDPARTFLPIADIKAFIVEMARFKFNTLHLHLMDDQAWRVEIKKYPRLTQVSAQRAAMDDIICPSDGYYTQAELRDLVAFAARYHVQIIPELELPGHEVAAIHAYPWLTCTNNLPDGGIVPLRTTCGVSNELLCASSPRVRTFIKDVLTELADIFPAPYIHLGGDEAGQPPLACWSQCPLCSQWLGQHGEQGKVAPNWKLQKDLFDETITYLRDTLHKTPMYWWEEDFQEVQPGCVTYAWRNGKTKAAIDNAKRNGVQMMLCPGEHCYFDYPMNRGDIPEVNWGMPTTTLHQTWSIDPTWHGTITDTEGSKEGFGLLGVSGTLWSESIPNISRLYYMAYPRAHALAERAWTGQQTTYADFLLRLRHIQAQQRARGITVNPHW